MTDNCGFCTIPGKRCSNKVRIELRSSYKNTSENDEEIKSIFYIDGPKGLLGEVVYVSPDVIVPSGESFLFSSFIESKDHVGKRKISAEIFLNGKSIFIGTRTIDILSCSTRALPFIDTAWLEPFSYCMGKDRATAEDVSEYLALLKSTGIHTCIITYTESMYSGMGAFYPTSVPELQKYPAPLEFDFVGTVMETADKLDMDIFMGLGRGDDLMLTWDGFLDQERVSRQIEYSKAIAEDLWDKYGKRKSFYGWYLAHEADDLARPNNYYNPVSAYLHSFDPSKPVLTAPAGTPIVDHNILNSCDYDIIAYQDAVGSGYKPYVNTFDQEVRIKMLHDIYSRYENAHIGTNKHIWTDLEIWKMDGPEYGNSYASPYHQVARQIEIERSYVDSISCYSFPGMFESPDQRFHCSERIEAKQLFLEYSEYYKKAGPLYGISEETDNG